MFDYVRYTAPCKKCGEIISEWQSKDANCTLKTVDPGMVMNFYGSCPLCNEWHNRKVVVTSYTIIDPDLKDTTSEND
jgi:hypothetical protein